jgi:hypothetical protein
MWQGILIIGVFVLILISLFSGLFFMMKDKGNGTRTVKALSFRVGLSVALFLLILLGFATGLIEPHGIYPHKTETPRQPAE